MTKLKIKAMFFMALVFCVERGLTEEFTFEEITAVYDFESLDTSPGAIVLDEVGILLEDGNRLKTAPNSGAIKIAKSGQFSADAKISLRSPIAGNIIHMNGIKPYTVVSNNTLPEEFATNHGLILDFGTDSNTTLKNLQFDTQKLEREYFSYVALYSQDNGQTWTIFQDPTYVKEGNSATKSQHFNFDGNITDVDAIRIISYARSSNNTDYEYAIDNIQVTYIAKVSPVIGLEIQQSDNQLEWSVENQRDIKEYQIIDTCSDEIIDIIPADHTKSYSTILPVGVSAKIVVVDHSGYSQSFFPENNYKITTSYSLNPGWNLISLPGENADQSALKAATTGEYWIWDGKVYQSRNILEPLQGTWVYAVEASQIEITSEKTDSKLMLEIGWNLIGPAENIEAPADYLIFGWDKAYEQTNVMTTGNGYWIFSEDSGIIEMP